MRGAAEITDWLVERLPDGWFVEPPEVLVDRDEILIIGRIDPDDGPEETRIERFRESTREHRMRLAREAEVTFGRKVSWGARCGDLRRIFTALTVPAMTRLRFAERAVLDTLIDAGVARSRSEALAWCVWLVGQNESEWLGQLRDAFEQVERVRSAGPKSRRATGQA
jgi:hypothetical protein